MRNFHESLLVAPTESTCRMVYNACFPMEVECRMERMESFRLDKHSIGPSVLLIGLQPQRWPPHNKKSRNLRIVKNMYINNICGRWKSHETSFSFVHFVLGEGITSIWRYTHAARFALQGAPVSQRPSTKKKKLAGIQNKTNTLANR